MLSGCGDDGQECLGVNCNDEVGEETGPEEIPGCWPELPGQPAGGGADEVGDGSEYPGEGVVFACEGSGNGWATVEIRGWGTEVACLNTPDGVKKPTPQDCQSLPIDLDQVAVGQPWVCCTESTGEDRLEEACSLDCGHAACKLAAQRILETALPLGDDGPYGRAKSDLLAFHDMLLMPDQQEKCAQAVRDAQGALVDVSLGEGTSDDKPGHIENLTLSLQCDVEYTEQIVEAGECIRSAHTPDKPDEQDHDGLIFGGSATFHGPEAEGESELVDGALGVRVATCDEEPCTITLTRLDARFENVVSPRVELTNVTARLRRPAQAWRTGTTVVFPAGSIMLDVHARALLDGEPLSSEVGSVLQVSNVQPAVGSLSEDGTFALEQASFRAGSFEVTLRIEPSPTEPVAMKPAI